VSYLRAKREAFRAKGLLFQTVVVTLSLLAGFGLVVGGLSFAIVSATRAVFPSPEGADPAATEETLATGEKPGQSGPAPSSSPGGRKVARTSGPLAKRPGETRPSRGDTTE
jgi:hypothetical protein